MTSSFENLDIAQYLEDLNKTLDNAEVNRIYNKNESHLNKL